MKKEQKKIPEMGRRVPAIEDQLVGWIYVLVDPFSPGFYCPPISFHCIKPRIDIFTFFKVIFPVPTGPLISSSICRHLFRKWQPGKND